MNFLKNLWARILALDNQPLEAEINRYKAELGELKDELKSAKSYLADTLNKLTVCYSEKLDLEDTNDEIFRLLQFYEADNEIAERPDLDVNWDKRPYFATTKFIYYNEAQKKNITMSAQLTPGKFYKLYTDEMYQYVMNGMKGYENKTLKQQVVRLRDLVCNRVTYHRDFDSEGTIIDNWKLPIQTFYERNADCEDMTGLWLNFCKIYGIKPNRVFNLTGYYDNSGHSFGGFIDDDGEMLIVECTSMLTPIKMKGSRYRCKGSINGLTNWAFEGVPLVEQF